MCQDVTVWHSLACLQLGESNIPGLADTAGDGERGEEGNDKKEEEEDGEKEEDGDGGELR